MISFYRKTFTLLAFFVNSLWYNPTLPQKTCSKPCNTWPRACFFENNYIPTVYSFISVLIFRKSPLV